MNTSSSTSSSGNISVSNSAENNYAAVTNQQYQDWLTRFYPQQKQLLDQTQSGELLDQQLARVDDNFSSAQNSATLANVNQMGRYGVQATDDENNQAKTSLAAVTAKNSLRENEQDRAMSVLSGSPRGALAQMNVG
ncbi:hypothetical protein J0X00_05880 [Vibrio sp. ABG19]|nr:hypothetical protein J0X00_05880 [Vibrio sp. ABG19]